MRIRGHSQGFLPIFWGTFQADDTVSGPISSLALTIGGLDIATSHPSINTNVFDPGTLTLSFTAYDPANIHTLVFFNFFGAPTNYVAAVEANVSGIVDPYEGNTQNWAGTFSISSSPPGAVPLPAALPLFAAGLGALGLLGRRRKRKAAALAA